jgi:aromatic ring-opening dioxygenase LigB subunit
MCSQWLRHELDGFETVTAQYARLDQISDSKLINVIEGRFDVLVTLDRNLVFEQKMAGRQISVIVLRVLSQTPASFRAVLPSLQTAISNFQPGYVQVVGP